jgi:RNA polymerase sigma factor (sigma-70 family)
VVRDNSEVAASPPRTAVAVRKPAPRQGPFYRDMELLFLEHKSGLERCALFWGASRSEAPDLVSTVLVAMLKNPLAIDDLTSYAYRAVRNATWDSKTRSQFRLQRRMVEKSQFRPETADDPAMNDAEFQRYLEYLMSEYLTPRQREVLSLFVNGLSYREIADHLGNTPEAVRQHMHHIRQRLDGPIRRDQGLLRDERPEPSEEMT